MYALKALGSLAFIATAINAKPFEARAVTANKTGANPSKPRGYGFTYGEPQSADGKGGPILGGTDNQIDVSNPSNLGQQSTDAGVVPNLKWRFADSHVNLKPGGWTREQVVTDLPVGTDIAAAQQHLKKGAIREMHWHRVAEWGWVYAGRVLTSAVDADGKYQVDILGPGDVWYCM